MKSCAHAVERLKENTQLTRKSENMVVADLSAASELSNAILVVLDGLSHWKHLKTGKPHLDGDLVKRGVRVALDIYRKM